MKLLALYEKIILLIDSTQKKLEQAKQEKNKVLSVFVYFKLYFLHSIKILIRFLSLLFGDSSENFLIFSRLNKDSLVFCNNSFCQYKKMEKKVRYLSKTAFILVLVSTILTSTILYFFFPGKPSGKAADFSWTQSNWSGSTDGGTYYTHTNNLNCDGTSIDPDCWTKYTAGASNVSASASDVRLNLVNTSWDQNNWTTESTSLTAAYATDRTTWAKYYSKEDQYINATSTQLSLSSIPGTYTETSAADFAAGTLGNTYTSGDSVILKLPPVQVTGLAITVGNAQVALNWSSATDNGSAVTNYRVYRGTSSGGEVLLGSGGCSGLGNVLTCTDTGLTNGTTYYYKVSAVNAIGEGIQSSETNTVPGYIYTIAAGSCSGTITTEFKVYYVSTRMLQWKTTGTNCDTPQCGQNGAQNGDRLVSPITNPNVDFAGLTNDLGGNPNNYPAQQNCKSIGGRLPTRTELACIWTNRASLGTFLNYDNYWSDEETSTNSAWANYWYPTSLSWGNILKTGAGTYAHRCVR